MVLVQIVAQSPRLAIGSVFIEENIVPIEHVQHRVALIRILVVIIGDVNINTPLNLFAAEGRNGDVPLFDHPSSLLQSMVKGIPSIVYHRKKGSTRRKCSGLCISFGFLHKKSGICFVNASRDGYSKLDVNMDRMPY